jgi:Zn-dependent M28 family amino/carboxypeptidase
LFKTFLLATALVCAPFVALAADTGQIDPAKISQHTKVLSSDSFEGRGPATPGEDKTVAYIVEQMKAYGLQPGGDLKNGQRAWTQDVPLARFENKGEVKSSVTAGGQTTAYTQGEQIALRPASNGASHVTVKDAPIVFIGYGVKAPERNWDDFKGVDLKGKIALVLINDPDFETGKGDFGGKAMTYYGRWTYKYEEAARQGAIGFIVVHETAPASYGWATVKNSNTIATFDIVRPDPTKDHALVEGWIQRDAAADIFKKAGLDYDAAKKAAQSRDFKPVTLTGATFSADYSVDVSKVVSKNVAGLLPGAKRPGEYVVYSAHWDHLGIGPADAKGDVIYNGAIDNASGIGDLLELGRVYAKAPRTDRSILFLAVTAEEKGLLGSEYYATAPLYPLAKTVANLNMDALDLGGPAKDFSVRGDSGVTLTDDLIAVATKHGRAFSPDPRPEAGSFYRSDHFSLAKRGVPAISYNAGTDLKTGGVAAGKAWKDAYNAAKYHQPADEWSADLDFTGQAEDVNILYETGRNLANSTGWPGWKAGAEFKAVRDATADQRK